MEGAQDFQIMFFYTDPIVEENIKGMKFIV